MTATFLETLSPPLQEQAHACEELTQLLANALQEAQDAWPQLSLSPETFATYLAEQCNQTSPKHGLSHFFSKLQASDLFLACACAQEAPDALQAFERQYAGLLIQTARRYASAQHPEEDLLQTLREKLFVQTPTRPPKIRAYSGQGPLHSWLRITATRTFLDCVRSGAQHKREHTDRDQQLLNAPDTHQGDLELEFLKREYRAEFKEAFAQALAALESAERNLLRQHYLSNLSIDQIGAIYHIHRATAARRIARARESLMRETKRALTQRLHISSQEFDSLMGMINSRLEVSLHRLLRSTHSNLQPHDTPPS